MKFSKLTSFTYLNIVQFLGGLNDNIFKLVIVYMLIDLKGTAASSTILAIAGAVFVLPFLLFSMPSGILADRHSKRNIIVFTKAMELVVMSFGLTMIYFRSTWGVYLALFFLAAQSAIFSPSKYGIIPELVHPRRLSRANGLLSLMTFLAIIFGTFLASFLIEIRHRNYVFAGSFCELIAVLGFFASLKIEPTQAKKSDSKIHLFFLYDVYKSLLLARKKQALLTIIIGCAYFWYIGAYTQLNIIPYAIQSLGLSDLYGGYLFLCTAFGIGLGSILAGTLSGKSIELGLIIWGALGISTCFVFLGFFDVHIIPVIIFLVLMGLFGGLFIVPVDTFIQYVSPVHDRGRIIASSSFLSFTGILLASATLSLFSNKLNMTSAQGFKVMGLLSFLMTIVLACFIFERFLRLFLTFFSRVLLHIHTSEKYEESERCHSLFICSYPYWIKCLALMTTSPRMIFLIAHPSKHKGFIKKMLGIAKIYFIEQDPDFNKIQNEWQHALNRGRSICIFKKEINSQEIEDTRFVSLIIEKSRTKTSLLSWLRKSKCYIALSDPKGSPIANP